MPPGNDASPEKRLRTYDDDDIVRYSLGLDVPIVGLLRNREEYKEMREIALIYGTTLGIRAKAPQGAPLAAAQDDAGAAPVPSVDDATATAGAVAAASTPHAPTQGE